VNPPPDEAIVLAQEAVAIETTNPGTCNNPLTYPYRTLAQVLLRRGRYAEAETALKEAFRIAIRQDILLDRLYALEVLANVLDREGKFSESEEVTHQAMDLSQKFIGPDSQRMAINVRKLAETLLAEHRLPEAAAAYRQAIAIGRKQPEQSYMDGFMADVLGSYGLILQEQKKPAEAESCFREALSFRQKIWPGDPNKWNVQINRLSDALTQQGKYSDIDRLFADLAASFPSNSPAAMDLLKLRAKIQSRTGH
jgi:tetratricopeptide (TPR) repeat protein